MEKTLHVLAIDDDPTQLALTGVMCSSVPYPKIELQTADKAETAFEIVERDPIDLVITDYRLPEYSGFEVLKRVKRINPMIAVVVLTAFESTKEALEVMKNGADDYLIKPLRHSELEHLLVRTAERQTLQRESSILRSDVKDHFKSDFIIYCSEVMAEVLNVAARSATSSATVLIRGESGTGKELIAQLIHYTSGRKERPFVTVNVAALSETLVESELFGHRKGSYTGATSDRVGRFEEADGGTLFIDEIGDISPGVQVKLLRALQSGQIQRVGDNSSIDLNVRIIAATSRNLEEMIRDNLFRVDLFYRLNVIPIHIPALRDRKIDIPPLVDHFVQRFNTKNEKEITSISHEALDRLMKYDFPGNVRELENIVERAIILARGSAIMERDLPETLRAATSPASAPAEGSAAGEDGEPASGPAVLPPDGYDHAIQEYERKLLLRALQEAGGNQSAAARILGIGERRLRSRLQTLSVENPFRD